MLANYLTKEEMAKVFELLDLMDGCSVAQIREIQTEIDKILALGKARKEIKESGHDEHAATSVTA